MDRIDGKNAGVSGGFSIRVGARSARSRELVRWLRWTLPVLLCTGASIASAQLYAGPSRAERLKRIIAEQDKQTPESRERARQREADAEDRRNAKARWFFIEAASGMAARAHPLASASSAAASLTTFTPNAAFRGNQTVSVGRALEAFPAHGDSVLARANGCALAQYAYPDLSSSDSTGTVSLTGVEAYFRRLAGLAPTAPSYPAGCADRASGTPSTSTALLGQAANGDILVAFASDQGTISVERISAAGAVISRQTLATGASPTLAVADLNGDGFADIVSPYWTAADGSTGVAVFLSQPSGSYSIPAHAYPYGVAVSANLARVSVEDVDGDGKLDVVAIGGSSIFSGALMTLRGDGTGGFSLAGSPLGLINAIGQPFVLADFDGNGRKDILTADGLFFGGAGAGSFSAPVQRLNLAISQPVGNLAVGDFNGDGKLDVAVLGSLGGTTGRFVSVFIGRGDGTFSAGPTYSGVRGADEIAVTDIDGDGIADIWIGKATSGVYSAGIKSESLMQFLLGKGDGTFAGAPVLSAPGSRGLPTFALADFKRVNIRITVIFVGASKPKRCKRIC